MKSPSPLRSVGPSGDGSRQTKVRPMTTVTEEEVRASRRARAVEALVREARELNDTRTPDHQERIAKVVASVTEYFRDPAGGLRIDEGSLVAHITDLVRASGSSREGYRQAIDALANRATPGT